MRRQTQASLQACADEGNRKRRLTQKETIKKLFNDSPEIQQTIRGVQKMTGLNYMQTQKRMSTLVQEGFLRIVGTRKEQGNPNSIFKKNPTQGLFDNAKKSKVDLLKQALRKLTSQQQEQAILDEFNRLLKYQNKS